MPKLTIDGTEIEVESGITLIQACEMAGVEIPRFCFHDRLSVAGNCRMCLVEVEGAPKLAASCAQPVADNMIIHTKSDKVRLAREGVMEFLLINHPLDCPICDQGGECDLQDQAMVYGRGNSRYTENKRAVKDKDMGPLISTNMTRCIHCTRCVRFVSEVAGTDELGALGRGEHMEITALNQAVTTEVSGNVIDLCPVGALTSKPYAFRARSWELNKTETIDVMDAVGSNIRVDSKGSEIMRILPALNEDINEEWISDKTRFCYDGLSVQRLDKAYIRSKGGLKPVTLSEAIQGAAAKLKQADPNKVGAIVGGLADAESMYLLKELMNLIGSANIDGRVLGSNMHYTDRSQYIFNSSISGIEEADLCLLIGCNPRHEATILNTRIRKATAGDNKLKVYSIGELPPQTYPVETLSHNLKIINDIMSGSHDFAKILSGAKNPMIIIGEQITCLGNATSIMHDIYKLAEKYKVVSSTYNGMNLLHTEASRVAALDLGLQPGNKGLAAKAQIEKAQSGAMDVIYLLNADNEVQDADLSKCFVIYQGHHGDYGAKYADIILPGVTYTEKNATYVNLEGRSQHTYKAVSADGDATEDWKIIYSLLKLFDYQNTIESVDDVRVCMSKVSEYLTCYGKLPAMKWKTGKKEEFKAVPSKIIRSFVDNYYMDNVVTRSSATMAKCAKMSIERERLNA